MQQGMHLRIGLGVFVGQPQQMAVFVGVNRLVGGSCVVRSLVHVVMRGVDRMNRSTRLLRLRKDPDLLVRLDRLQVPDRDGLELDRQPDRAALVRIPHRRGKTGGIALPDQHGPAGPMRRGGIADVLRKRPAGVAGRDHRLGTVVDRGGLAGGIRGAELAILLDEPDPNGHRDALRAAVPGHVEGPPTSAPEDRRSGLARGRLLVEQGLFPARRGDCHPLQSGRIGEPVIGSGAGSGGQQLHDCVIARLLLQRAERLQVHRSVVTGPLGSALRCRLCRRRLCRRRLVGGVGGAGDPVSQRRPLRHTQEHPLPDIGRRDLGPFGQQPRRDRPRRDIRLAPDRGTVTVGRAGPDQGAGQGIDRMRPDTKPAWPTTVPVGTTSLAATTSTPTPAPNRR